MEDRKKYALVSIATFIAFATIFVLHYHVNETIGEEGVVVGTGFEYSGYRYLAKVNVSGSCLFYLPLPSSRNGILKPHPEMVEVPEGWVWSLKENMLALNVTGSGTFVAYYEVPHFNETVDVENPKFLLKPSRVYSSCPAKVHVELVGERHWKEYRKMLIWTKEILMCGCYRNWMDVEGKGWIDAESKVTAGVECRITKCLMCFYCGEGS